MSDIVRNPDEVGFVIALNVLNPEIASENCLGLTDTSDPAQMRANMAKRKEATSAAEIQRESLRKSILFKSYEFNCHGVEMNQRYKSAAIVADDTPQPEYLRDRELYYQASTRPGSRLPHVWLGENGHRISTLDLAGKGRFTLFTGIGGEKWLKSAQTTAEKFNIELGTVQVGPGKDYTDLYGEWAEAREIADSGCLLIRPDFHVAYRAQSVAADPEAELTNAFNQLFGK